MLTEKRKADREAMAAMVEALCAEMGASAVRAPQSTLSPRCLRLEIVMQDARVGLDFDGEAYANVDCYCMPWNIRIGADVEFTYAFGFAVGATVNPHHGRKCMGFADGIDDLLARLRAALQCIADGEAFKPERERATDRAA